MNDITIVTAFYDIGREDWEYYTRKTSYYFECFERLCQLKNKIVVFSEIKFKSLFDKIICNIKPDLVVIYEDIFDNNKVLLDITSSLYFHPPTTTSNSNKINTLTIKPVGM